jgi:hypothetical protein
MLVPEIKAQHDSDKSADRVVLAHGPKAQPKHDTVDFYSGRADPFDPSCCVPGLACHAMNSPMTSTTALATAAATVATQTHPYLGPAAATQEPLPLVGFLLCAGDHEMYALSLPLPSTHPTQALALCHAVPEPHD